MDNIDKLWQFVIALFGAGLSYVVYCFKKDKEVAMALSDKYFGHEKDIAVIREQVKNLADKQDYIVLMCEDLKESNTLIIEALVHKKGR